MTAYRWTLLDAGPILLDGGSMFGLIPRVVWTRTLQPDDRNRIRLRHNALLLESVEPDSRLGRPRRVVIEAGTGDKLDAKMSEIFGLSRRTIEAAVGEAGMPSDQVDAVIVTHLHFDHAGGVTRRARPGERPDWTAPNPHAASGDATGVKLTFPNARIYTQHREWEDALANNSVMTRTYYRDHLEPIAGHVELIDAAAPFHAGHRPGRDELPTIPLDHRITPALPGIDVLRTPGHTWGQQAILFTDDRGRTVVFTPDVMPTVHHAAAYSLAYDVEPYTSMVTKRWFLGAAAEREWLLVLDHEPGNPCQRVKPDGKGWFTLSPEPG